MKTLILDNYDSFTYNLYQYVGELGGNPYVVRNDEISIEEIDGMCHPEHGRRADTSGVTHIIIGPGPGNPDTPRDIGISDALIDFAMKKSIPLLGVCLGHQVLGRHFGSVVSRAPIIMHGKASVIHFADPRSNLFTGLPNEIEVMRYHSLHVESCPADFRITARTHDGIIMAMEHITLPLFGVQFHPESVGTGEGKNIIRQFLSL